MKGLSAASYQKRQRYWISLILFAFATIACMEISSDKPSESCGLKEHTDSVHAPAQNVGPTSTDSVPQKRKYTRRDPLSNKQLKLFGQGQGGIQDAFHGNNARTRRAQATGTWHATFMSVSTSSSRKFNFNAPTDQLHNNQAGSKGFKVQQRRNSAHSTG